jgi:hypothetical protein
MGDHNKFSARCPTCRKEVGQRVRHHDAVRRMFREGSLSLYCDSCDHNWEPSDEELANIELLLS